MSTLIYGLFMTGKRIHHSLRCIHIHQIDLVINIQNIYLLSVLRFRLHYA